MSLIFTEDATRCPWLDVASPDMNGDGNVGASDLLALLANWGPCP